MTPYEMLDLAQSSYSTSAAYISIFIALLSAYIVAAYIAGIRLSSTQFLLANCVYLVLQLLSILTIYNFTKSANLWVDRARADMNISDEGSNIAYIPETVALILLVTMLLSAWFMWKSRSINAE